MTINGTLLGMLLCGIAWGIVGALTGHGGGTILGFGQQFICMDSDGFGNTVTADISRLVIPHPGASTEAITRYQLCADHPSAVQRWWYSLELFPGTLTVLVVALMTFLALRQAQISGLYVQGFASKLRFLGWFLLVESLAQKPVESFAGDKLWHTLGAGPVSQVGNVGWFALFAGLALLSLARIMRVGSAMREDLEGVV